MSSLHNLLNPLHCDDTSFESPFHMPSSATKENVRPQLDLLSTLSGLSESTQAPSVVKHALDLAVSYFTSIGNIPPMPPSSQPIPLHAQLSLSGPTPPGLPLSRADSEIPTRQNVQLNRQTTLETVYYYPVNTLVEYPETSVNGRIGHIFSLDPLNWINPVLNFAYSLGGSHGMSQRDRSVTTALLVDDLGDPVPCRESHTTCMYQIISTLIYAAKHLKGQGCKICPFNDQATTVPPHCRATRDDLYRNLIHTKRLLQSRTDLPQQLLMKTLSLWSSFQRMGCGAPLYEATLYFGTERDGVKRWDAERDKARRGHEAKSTCQGRLLFEYNYQGLAYVRWVFFGLNLCLKHLQFASSCEHYNRMTSPDHLINYDVGSGLYDTDYLEALFLGDEAEVTRLEMEVFAEDDLPTQSCTTVSNSSSIKVCCRACFVLPFKLS